MCLFVQHNSWTIGSNLPSCSDLRSQLPAHLPQCCLNKRRFWGKFQSVFRPFHSTNTDQSDKLSHVYMYCNYFLARLQPVVGIDQEHFHWKTIEHLSGASWLESYQDVFWLLKAMFYSQAHLPNFRINVFLIMYQFLCVNPPLYLDTL